MIMLENFLLEVSGITIVTVAAYVADKYFKFTPLDKTQSAFYNSLLFTALPAAVYVACRVYFWFCLWVYRRVNASAPKYRVPDMAWYGMLTLGFMITSSAIKSNALVVKSLHEFVDAFVGQLPAVIYAQSEQPVIAAYKFGLRIFGLIVGWFILLFSLERIVAILLWLLRFALRSIFGKKAAVSSTENKGKDL